MGKCSEHDWIAMICRKCGGFLGMGCLNCDAWADGGERLASSPDEWCKCENPDSDYPVDDCDEAQQSRAADAPKSAPVCTCSMDDGIHEWNCVLESARR